MPGCPPACRRPAAEQIHLFLNGEEQPDLFEEGLEFVLGEVGVELAFQPTALQHQLFQQPDSLLARAER
jgi:hypothetical protein